MLNSVFVFVYVITTISRVHCHNHHSMWYGLCNGTMSVCLFQLLTAAAAYGGLVAVKC